MTEPTRVLLLVDAFAGIGTDEWIAAVGSPLKREHVFVLSTLGAPRVEAGVPPAWIELGAAVEKLVEAGLALASQSEGSFEFYVGGQAPLPLFAHVGFRLSKFSGKQVFLARPQSGGAIEVFDLGRVPTGAAPLQRASSLPTAPAFGTGAVAIYIDTAGRPPMQDRIGQALTEAGQGSLALLELGSDEPTKLTPETAAALALQLTEFFSRVPSLYPKSESLALFVAGPTLLAFLVGRAMNPTLTPRALLMNFSQGSYTLAYALPFTYASHVPIDMSAEGHLRRRATRDVLVAAIDELRKELKADDLPIDAPMMSADRASALVTQLGGLAFSKSDTDEFELSLTHGELAFGTGLLEALRGLDDPMLRDLAKLFVLHELVHDTQALRTTNFRGVGRAAVALEQVDYAADAFAVRAALQVEVRRGGERAAEPAAMRDATVRLIDAVLSGIEAFDQMEHGAQIDRLTERRMRRYLIWHLQLARAKTITTIDDVATMLRDAITVELAPLLGRIDPRRHEKVVTQATAETELFCAVGGRLVRVRASHDFDTQATLQALRSYGRQPLEKVMHYVVSENRSVLAPWRP